MTAIVETSQVREVSGLVMQALMSYVTRASGPGFAEQVARDGGWHDIATLGDGDRWFSFEETLRVAAAASAATADVSIGRRVGEEQVILLCENGLRDFLLSLETVPAAVETVALLGSRMSDGRTFKVVEQSDDQLVIEAHTGGDGHIDRFWCDYAAGVLVSIPPVLGMVARVSESVCQARGGQRCRFVLSWMPDPRFADRPSEADASRARVEERLATFEYVQAMASDLLASHDIDDVLDRMCEHAARSLEAPRFLIAVRISASDRLRVHHRGFCDDAVAMRRAHQLLAGERDFVGETALVKSVGGGDEVHGLIAAFGPADVGYIAWEERTLGAYARHAASALDIVAALDGAQHDRDIAHGLLELSTVLAHASTVDEVATHLVRCVPTVAHADVATLWTWHPDANEFRIEACRDLEGTPWPGPAAVGVGEFEFDLAAMLVASPQPFVLGVNEVGDLRSLFDCERTSVAAVVPIVARDELLGVLTAAYRSDVAIEDVTELTVTMQGLAAQGATALVNVRLLEAARHQASHDALTGLPNRDLVEARAEGISEFAVLFVDLDEFKSVNDTLGHSAGDELLRLASERLAEVMRPGDTLGRLGGDEFIVLVPGIDSFAAVKIGERVVAALREPFDLGGATVRISCSVGVASGCAESYRAVVAAADAAMYEAKAAGRNCVAAR